MFVRNDVVHYSASDLTAAVTCEWALMRLLDAKLGRIEAVQEPEDLMQARAAVLEGSGRGISATPPGVPGVCSPNRSR